MTCIAIRNGVVAADSRMVAGWYISSRNLSKISKLRDGSVLVSCGNVAETTMLKDWMRKHWPTKEQPPFSNLDTDSCVIRLGTDGRITEMTKGGIVRVPKAEFYAHGCGRELAMGAMAMGASATEAVRIAAKFCAGVGGPIRQIRVGKSNRTASQTS